MITVRDNSVASINAALIALEREIQGAEKVVQSGSSESKTIINMSNTSELNSIKTQLDNLKNSLITLKIIDTPSLEDSLSSDVENLNLKMTELANQIGEIRNTLSNIVTNSGNTNNWIQEVADSSEGGSNEHYLGSYEDTPIGASEGDWYFNSVDVKLYKLENGVWGEVEYSSETAYMYNAAASDLLAYASTTGDVGIYAAAFISDLFAQKITIQEGGNIKSSNYNPDGTEGFLLDTDGKLYANEGFFRGKNGNLIKYGDFDASQVIEIDYKNKLLEDTNEECFKLEYYIRNLDSTFSYLGSLIFSKSYFEGPRTSYSNLYRWAYSIQGEYCDKIEVELKNDVIGGTSQYEDMKIYAYPIVKIKGSGSLYILQNKFTFIEDIEE